jgi:hypothetical protein
MFKTFYLVMKNADMTEGRGPNMPTGIGFLDKSEGKKYIDAQFGVMGRPAPAGGWGRYGDWELVPITIMDTADQAFVNARAKIKADALAKLTWEEKEALGL